MKRTIFNIIKNDKGLSLIEILIVLAIIGIFTLIAVPSVINYLELGRKKATEIELQRVDLFLTTFLANDNKYPETLNELMDSGLVKDKDGLKDGWGREYSYSVNSDNQGYILFSLGKDGISGSDDDLSSPESEN